MGVRWVGEYYLNNIYTVSVTSKYDAVGWEISTLKVAFSCWLIFVASVHQGKLDMTIKLLHNENS